MKNIRNRKKTKTKEIRKTARACMESVTSETWCDDH